MGAGSWPTTGWDTLHVATRCRSPPPPTHPSAHHHTHTHSPTCPLTHPSAHKLACPSTHPPTHPPTNSLATHPLTCPSTHPPTNSLVVPGQLDGAAPIVFFAGGAGPLGRGDAVGARRVASLLEAQAPGISAPRRCGPATRGLLQAGPVGKWRSRQSVSGASKCGNYRMTSRSPSRRQMNDAHPLQKAMQHACTLRDAPGRSGPGRLPGRAY